MNKSALCIALSAAFVGITAAPIAQAEEFRINKLYVLGDSLSDGGSYTQNVAAGLAANGVPSAVQPNRFRFTTNSPTTRMWNQVLADRLGISIDADRLTGVLNPQDGSVVAQPVTLNGGNYAEGGSRVSNTAGIGNTGTGQDFGITTLPVTEQVNRLLADRPNFNRNDLIALWAGSNDGFVQFATVGAGAITPQQAAANMATAATEMLAQIDRLKAAGAQNIAVVTVPDLGVTPQAQLINSGAPGSAALLTTLANTFNATLEQQAAAKGAVVIRSATLLAAVLADPAKYGFTAANATSVPACGTNPNATGPDNFYNSSLTCVQGLNASADSEQRVFADSVHPTAAAQAMFGEAAYAGLQAAAINGVLVAAPLTPIRQHALSLENRLSSFALTKEDAQGNLGLRPVGDMEWYGGVEVGNFESDVQQVQPGLDSDTVVTKIGADRMVTRNALVGVGLSFDSAETDFSNNGGGFDTDLIVGTLFTTIALSKEFYVNGAVAFGNMDYDVTRQFTLGASQERYSANTKSDFSLYRVGGGYIRNLDSGWTLNPQLSYTNEKIELDGYNESTGAASLSFGATEYKAERVSLALAVTKKPSEPHGWRPLLRFSFESDMNNDDILIRTGPDQNTLATIRAPRPDGDFQLLSIGAVKPVGPGLLNLHLASTFGQDGVDSLSVGIAYKASF